MRETSRRMAVCGLLCALAVVLMLLGGVIPLAVYACPILVMAVLLPIQEQYGARAALAAWAAVSVLSALLVPQTEQTCVYVFLGWYPAVQPQLDRLRQPVRFLGKLLLFNGAAAALYFFVLRILGLAEAAEDFSGLSRTMLALTVLLGNLVFFLTDQLLRRLRLQKPWKRFLK